MNGKNMAALAGFVGTTAGVAGIATWATQRSVDSVWYRMLRKASFQPPKRAFGPVWTTLYGLIALSGWRVWKAPRSPERTRALALWAAQLGLNGAWSAIFFGARKPKAALAEIGALLGSVGGYLAAAAKVDTLAAALVAPYAAWVAYASSLNEEIVRKN